jgi:SAM-dependent methyltransferase
MYRHLIGSLDRYPIPDMPLPAGEGRTLLDVGCSWGRWTIAAARRGYTAVGIDPSLGAVMAARRAAAQLGVDTHYVVGDARHLPFSTGRFDAVYSYSVLQHLSRSDATTAVSEVGRVLHTGGTAKVQMPTRLGIRCLFHQARRGFRDGRGFEVRYWSLPALRRLFSKHVGPSRVEVDCYFGIGLQPADAPLMTPRLKRILAASEFLKQASRHFSPLAWVADSVFVEAARTR